jgi:hypothetical protein
MFCNIRRTDMLAMVTGSIMSVLGRNPARRQRHLVATAAVLAWCFVQSAALAQTPYVPDEWKYGKRQDGAALNYCVDERDPDLPVAKEIGRAVAQALLLQPKEHAIGQNTVGEDIDNLYRVFLETCDVFL